jgi:hypothetical protein
VATVAAVEAGILPRFWDALEMLTVAVIVRHAWLYGPTAHHPVGAKIAGWCFVFALAFMLFELLQHGLHSTSVYAELVTQFRTNYARFAPQPMPFGDAAEAETEELGGLL